MTTHRKKIRVARGFETASSPSTSGRLASGRRPGGYVVVMAILTMAVVAAVAGYLTIGLQTEFHRTSEATHQAQLRQLLLAGCAAARQRMTEGNAAGSSLTVALPVDLVSDGATVKLTPDGSRTATDAAFTIDARYQGHRQSERVRFHRADAGWVLTDVAFDP
jgi:hypothetical protein